MMKLPWWPFYGRDFFDDEKVKLMSNAQIGMYVKLLDHQWKEGSISANIAFAAFMDLHNRKYDAALAEQECQAVLADCFLAHPTIPGRIYNCKMDTVRQEQLDLQQQKQRAGRRGGRVTQAKQRSSTASSTASSSAQQSQSQNQSQKKTQNQKEKESQKKEKIAAACEELAPAVNGVTTWEAYQRAYLARYGVNPVRNQTINSQLKQVAARLGQTEAPLVAAFYVTHNKPLYVSARHATNLLVRDAEGLRTEWATGIRATSGEAKNLEAQDNATSQVQRVRKLMEVTR